MRKTAFIGDVSLNEQGIAMFAEHTRVVLKKSLPQFNLSPGDVGIVLHGHGHGLAYEVEFLTDDGKTLAVLTLDANDLGEPPTLRVEPFDLDAFILTLPKSQQDDIARKSMEMEQMARCASPDQRIRKDVIDFDTIIAGLPQDQQDAINRRMEEMLATAAYRLQIILQDPTIFLTPREVSRFIEVMENPPPRNAKFLEAQSRHLRATSGEDDPIDTIPGYPDDRLDAIERAAKNQDFYRWTQNQADHLESGNLAALDLPNLGCEVRSLGSADLCQLLRLTRSLLIAMLVTYHTDEDTAAYRQQIFHARADIDLILEDSPSLREILRTRLDKVYLQAAHLASIQPGIAKTLMPASCPWPLEQVLTDEAAPESR